MNPSCEAIERDPCGVSEPSRRALIATRLLWLAAAAPAIGQLCLLLYTTLSRLSFPYDLEWMEGGLLGHAHRISQHQGIFVEPSVDFIPYLYTPLYPGLLALFGGIFGISYTLGRLLSFLAMLAILGFFAGALVRQRQGPVDRGAAPTGAALAMGLYAATYPWVEGWFDLVRADTLFVAMVVGGLFGISCWAGIPGPAGRRRIACAAAILALSFFCKQTGIFYVAAGGVALLLLDWRRVPLYIAVAGAIGLGGTWLFNRASGGWFWIYVREVHQVHDWNIDRFWASFGHILGRFPAMPGVIGAGLLAVGTAAFFERRLPPGSRALLYWSPIFALSCLVGAIGWGTQWAHFNAFIPAMTTGALAAGAAIPAMFGAASRWRPAPSWAPLAAALALAAGLAVQLALTWWAPARFIPTERDREAGDALIARLRSIEGEVFMPYHPWYPVMAGKSLQVHRMGLLDLTYGNKWKVAGMREAFREHRFAAVVLDNRPVGAELAGLRPSYRMDDILPAEEAPRVYSGAKVVPKSLWVPARRLALPDGATVLFDFESRTLDGWTRAGRAWGTRPVSGPVGDQGPVRRYGGRYYLSSYHGGDGTIGTLTSPDFAITGSSITFRISGGNHPETLRAELWVDGEREKTATGNHSERMEEVMWNVAPHAGKTARIVLVDKEGGPWGHLNIDEIWLRQ